MLDNIKRLLQESLPDAIGGVLSTIFLGIIGLLSGAFGIDTQLSLKIAIVGCYLLFLTGTVYVFAARRQGVDGPPSIRPVPLGFH